MVSFAAGFSVPQSSTEPRPLQWKPRMLTTMPPGNSLNIVFCAYCYTIRQWEIHQSVKFSCSVVSDSLRPYGLQHARPPCPSLGPILCHSLLCLPSIFPASGAFQMSQLFTSGGQSIGISATVSVLPVNTQDWSPLGWTGWISLQSKGLSRAFSNTTVQKHQFFGTQLSL